MNATDTEEEVVVDVDTDSPVACNLFEGKRCENEAVWVATMMCANLTETACDECREVWTRHNEAVMSLSGIIPGLTSACPYCHNVPGCNPVWRPL